ncbi:MAG TPA: metallopeptidase family protein [Gaiellales bacterium]
MVWQRIRGIFAGGDPWTTVFITLGLGVMGALTIEPYHRASPGSPSPAVFAPLLPIVFLLIWAATAKMKRDAAQVHRENVAIDQRQRRFERLMNRTLPFECSEQEFADTLERDLDSLPEWVRRDIEQANVAITVQDERDGSPLTLGLYSRTMGAKQITLYRTPIIRSAGRPEDLRRVVHETLLHELGHLFGMDESALDEYTIGNHPRPDATPVRPPDSG